MALTKTDLRDAKLLLKAGRLDAVRQILRSSNDPRALVSLAKLEARLTAQSVEASEESDELAEVKQLIRQKRFAEAEMLLRASDHPKAEYLLEKIAMKTSAAKPHTRKQLLMKSLSGVFSRFSRKAWTLIAADA